MVPVANALRFFGYAAARHSGVSLRAAAVAPVLHPWRKVIAIVPGRLRGGGLP
jgi:hypothetical protein